MVLKDEIKAVVFDFGNVIINIDLEKTYQAFADLTFKPVSKVKALFLENEIFRKYEIGFFDEEEFRDVVRQTLGYPLNDDEIDEAWNALLLDAPVNRIKYLEELRLKIPVYLLSNTNFTHIKASKKYFRDKHGFPEFFEIFNHAFFSYEIKLYKPDYEIYHHLIKELKLEPHQILFLDDNQSNIDAALEVGINAIKINPPEDFMPILDLLIE
ncbi:MAG: HAD family phosphatase [Bacteroidetes bacterium]|nr:HAD family phosphatase [Bacteroidota bacterium]